MSTTNSHTQPTNHEAFVQEFAELIASARANGQVPPTADAALAGMDLIADLYKRYPATETSAKLAVSLTEVLYFNFSEFGSCYLAVSQALDSQDDTAPSEIAELLDRVGLDATFAEAYQAADQTN